MGILHRHFEVALHSNGEELIPYGIEYESQTDVSAYIASRAGQTFTITCRNVTQMLASVSTYADGHNVRNSEIQSQTTRIIDGARVSLTKIVPFKFSEIELVESDEEGVLSSSSHGLGEILLKFYRLKTHGDGLPHYKVDEIDEVRTFLPENGIRMSERSKKAGGHCVSLDTSSQFDRVALPSSNAGFIDPLHSPYATFKIMYQPRDVLQAKGIMPRDSNTVSNPYSGSPGTKRRAPDRRSSTPVSQQPKRSTSIELADPLPPDVKPRIGAQNAQERRKRIKALHAELDGLLAAEDAEQGRSMPVKFERSHSSSRFHGFTGGKMIDLTGSDP